MAEPVRVRTTKYAKSGKVDVDGHIWDVIPPGLGTETRFSQASRAAKLYAARIDLLDKKIDKGTITEEELDKYENYCQQYEENEAVVYDIFIRTFRDSTKDNTEVKKWMDETPSAYIMQAFEDVKTARQKKAEVDGGAETPEEE